MTQFSKLAIPKLSVLRNKAGLSQLEVASRMKFKTRAGQSFVARLEKGKISRPSFDTILNYLDAVGVNWITFITELSNEREKQDHKDIMSKVKLPPDYRIQKKLDRDTRLYETKIKPPLNYYTKVDMELVNQKIENKVREYCQILKIKQELILHYIEFAKEIAIAKKHLPVIGKYKSKGLFENYLIRIQNIASKILHHEEEKVQRQKPLSREKRQKMAVKYLHSRVKLAPVENAVKNLLIENNLTKHFLFNSYTNFGRECYRVLQKYSNKDQSYMKQELAGLTKSWGQGGLDKEVMEKIKQAIYKLYNIKDNI